MLDFLKPPVQAFQDFIVLGIRAVRNIFRSPHYADDIFQQMDTIGVGSLPIVIMIGFFSGVVMTMQMAHALQQYGAQGNVGQIVSLALIRELGPLLTAVMVAGRNASGIASEIGSMKVTEQLDAMRALGTDPVQKLVTPRLIATVCMLPLLTIVADYIGLVGGWLVAYLILDIPSSQYWSSAWQNRGIQRRYRARAVQALGVRGHHCAGGLLLRHAHHAAERRAWARRPPRPWWSRPSGSSCSPP